MSLSEQKLAELIVKTDGDLSSMSARDKWAYYMEVCDLLGISPLTLPLSFIRLNGKLRLYAKKDATDQLRANREISVNVVSREFMADNTLFVVVARTMLPSGRTDESVGAVPLVVNMKDRKTGEYREKVLSGEALGNALMKAETKAKRRATLSIVGLGWLDETETDFANLEDVMKDATVTSLEELYAYANEIGLTKKEATTALIQAGESGFSKQRAPNQMKILVTAAKDKKTNEQEQTEQQTEANTPSENN